MGMNNETNLPKTQAAALEILKAAGTELEQDEWQARGANLNAIYALRRKGIVKIERRAYINERFFAGPTEMTGVFYTVA